MLAGGHELLSNISKLQRPECFGWSTPVGEIKENCANLSPRPNQPLAYCTSLSSNPTHPQSVSLSCVFSCGGRAGGLTDGGERWTFHEHPIPSQITPQPPPQAWLWSGPPAAEPAAAASAFIPPFIITIQLCSRVETVQGSVRAPCPTRRLWSRTLKGTVRWKWGQHEKHEEEQQHLGGCVWSQIPQM